MLGAAQVTPPPFLSPHRGDSRSGGHLTPQGRVPSSQPRLLIGVPTQAGTYRVPTGGFQECHHWHKHPGTAARCWLQDAALWGHTGLGTRVAGGHV